MKIISVLSKASLAGAAAFLLCGNAFAQSGDMIEGTVVDVDVQNQRGTLTVETSSAGARETYNVTPSTTLTVRNEPGRFLSRTADIDAIADLEPGDPVKLELVEDASGNVSARSIERDSPPANQRTGAMTDNRDMDSADTRDAGATANVGSQSRTGQSGSTQTDYDSLPSTASAMPLFALFGLISLLLAATMRGARLLTQKK
jgi:hypothetical protein